MTSRNRADTKNAQLPQQAYMSNQYLLSNSSLNMQNLMLRIKKVAKTDLTILISGETGTGKDIIAQFIHEQSNRANFPLVVVNFGSIGDALIESELFGHEKGAFTGASTTKKGKFELANNGTLYINEIADTTLPVQAKVLRFLEERTFERVGGSTIHRVNTRIIAATNKDLQIEIFEKRFREDLYYRLSVVTFELPPLRERREDIVKLAEFFLHKISVINAVKKRKLEPDTIKLLLDYPWPGNIRELQNVITRLLVLKDKKGHITPQEFSTLIEKKPIKDIPLKTKIKMPRELRTALKQYLAFFNEFVFIAKGKEIVFEIISSDDGLELVTEAYSSTDIDEINLYLREYISFIKQNIDDLKVVFETDVDSTQKNLLILSLRNEIQQLKFKVELKNVELNHLNKTVERLYNLLDIKYRNPKPFLAQFSQNNKQIQSVSVNVDFDMKTDLTNLQDEFLKLRESLLEKNPALKDELKEIDDHLINVNPNVQNRSDIDIGALNRLRRFLVKLNDPESEINKTLQAGGNLIKIVQKLGRTYNKIAQWLALPQIPDLLLGK